MKRPTLMDRKNNTGIGMIPVSPRIDGMVKIVVIFVVGGVGMSILLVVAVLQVPWVHDTKLLIGLDIRQ
jgi:hypothetical protein